MTAEVRRRWRRRLLWLGVLPLLVALAFTGKVTSMLLLEWQGHSAYDGGDFGSARDSFAANLRLNLLESWVAPYDEGTARLRAGDAAGAVRSLEGALERAPDDEQCRVRINLALAQEALGDAALAEGRSDAAGAAWRAGLETLAAGSCLAVAASEDPGASTEGQAGDARVVDTRLREKLTTAEAEVPPPPPTTPPTREEQLERRNKQGQDQRDQREQKEQDQPPPASSDQDEGEPPTYYW